MTKRLEPGPRAPVELSDHAVACPCERGTFPPPRRRPAHPSTQAKEGARFVVKRPG